MQEYCSNLTVNGKTFSFYDLEKAAKSHNCSIKVETRGSGGAKNVLTDEEIANADCVIVAADAQVPMDRFDGRKLLSARCLMVSVKQVNWLTV